MKKETLIKILKLHGLKVISKGTKLFTEDNYSLNGILHCDWIECQYWNNNDLDEFLGY
tara:strand:- start:220 stop:393 length:174 start_codon:yes stop_codon:yes gene_type:complete